MISRADYMLSYLRAIATLGLIIIPILLEPIPLSGFWLLCILMPLMLLGIAGQYLKFMSKAVLPIGIVLCVLWGGIVQAPPGQDHSSDQIGGLLYAYRTTLRLATIGGVAQMCFLSISASSLSILMRIWHVPNHVIVGILGGRILVPEMHARSEQIVVARKARGLLSCKTKIKNIIQLPAVLMPLFAWTLRAAIQRAEMWEMTQLINQFEKQNEFHDLSEATNSNIALILVSLVGLMLLLSQHFLWSEI